MEPAGSRLRIVSPTHVHPRTTFNLLFEPTGTLRHLETLICRAIQSQCNEESVWGDRR